MTLEQIQKEIAILVEMAYNMGQKAVYEENLKLLRGYYGREDQDKKSGD